MGLKTRVELTLPQPGQLGGKGGRLIRRKSSAPNEKFKKSQLRLRAELRKLRKMYEEQTTKAKNEYMLVHSKQV